jgi:hypothetical protein
MRRRAALLVAAAALPFAVTGAPVSASVEVHTSPAWILEGSFNSPGDAKDQPLVAADCGSAMFCAASGDYGARMLATNTGGAPWHSTGGATVGSNANGDETQLSAFLCARSSNCIAAGSYPNNAHPSSYITFLEATTNRGASWRRLSTGTKVDDNYPIEGLACPTQTYCIALGHSESDSGLSTQDIRGDLFVGKWRQWPVGTLPAAGDGGYTDVACSSTSTCIAVGGRSTPVGAPDAGVIALTRNKGSSWSIAAYVKSWVPESVQCADGGTCVAWGSNQESQDCPCSTVLVSHDSGSVWRAAHLPEAAADVDYLTTACLDATTCFAIDGSAFSLEPSQTLFESTDGGISFHVASGPPGRLKFDGLSCDHGTCWLITTSNQLWAYR